MHALFMYCTCTVYAFKNIKNGSHDTIHTVKNYFATVFLVFSFQFSVLATISSIQTDPNLFWFALEPNIFFTYLSMALTVLIHI